MIRIINEWSKIIGNERAKVVSDIFFDKKIDLNFPNLKQFSYEYKHKTILIDLEEAGSLLKSLEGKILTQNEVIAMMDIYAKELIDATLPSEFENIVYEALKKELEGEQWWNDQLKEIEDILRRLNHREKRTEKE